MKLALIIFHKNVDRYPKAWIKRCVDSIRNQSYKDFNVFELDYSGGTNQVYKGSNFDNKICNNHAEAHNYLLDKVFSLGFDYAFNSNVDDIYSNNRIEKQLPYLKAGYDVVSSNFIHIDENDKPLRSLIFHSSDIEYEASRNHNIIAHPVCAYSRYFWLHCTKLRGEEIPLDDFELWKRSYKFFNFIIVPEFLLYYRIHSLKVSAPGAWTK